VVIFDILLQIGAQKGELEFSLAEINQPIRLTDINFFSDKISVLFKTAPYTVCFLALLQKIESKWGSAPGYIELVKSLQNGSIQKELFGEPAIAPESEEVTNFSKEKV
jgi:hypothetical protein